MPKVVADFKQNVSVKLNEIIERSTKKSLNAKQFSIRAY